MYTILIISLNWSNSLFVKVSGYFFYCSHEFIENWFFIEKVFLCINHIVQKTLKTKSESVISDSFPCKIVRYFHLFHIEKRKKNKSYFLHFFFFFFFRDNITLVSEILLLNTKIFIIKFCLLFYFFDLTMCIICVFLWSSLLLFFAYSFINK